jgi:CubicO group peptidase (beta-lactamase class C family)
MVGFLFVVSSGKQDVIVMTSNSAAVRSLLERGVSEGVFCGAQSAWARRGTPVEGVWAGATRAHGQPVGPETLFDVASLTKPIVASAALSLVARDALDLRSDIGSLVPQLRGEASGRATLEQLLAHEAGFVDWAPFFEQVEPELCGTRAGGAAIVELACRLEAAAEPGLEARYSDLGFIVLLAILERATGESLDTVVAREVTDPLGLKSARFRAILRSSPRERSRTDENHRRSSCSARLSPSYAGLHDDEASIAATEDCPWRGRVLVGEVHDDNAWAMGGVAGHAGLFANAGDVARFGSAWLDALDGSDWLPVELASKAVERRPLGRGLGWDLKSVNGSSAGEQMGPRTFGHLGFTGCSLWVDPDAGLSVALLSNRVHPSRDNEAIREFRPAFHDALLSIL